MGSQKASGCSQNEQQDHQEGHSIQVRTVSESCPGLSESKLWGKEKE